VLLYAVAWPPQGIFSNRPIADAADLKGLKWRAHSPQTARIAELLGAQPVTVQAAELPQAIASDIVEGYMSSGPTGLDSKSYEILRLLRHAGVVAQNVGGGPPSRSGRA
jgi:TRAP-type C4-dicarboxylate transport system substrate-binding protein